MSSLVSKQQLHVLRVLATHGPRTPYATAAKGDICHSTARQACEFLEQKGLVQAERRRFSSTREKATFRPTLPGLLELVSTISDKTAFQIVSRQSIATDFPIFEKFTVRTNKILLEALRDIWRRLRTRIQGLLEEKPDLSIASPDDILPRVSELSESQYTWAESFVKKAVESRLESRRARDSAFLVEELENRIYTMLFILPFHESTENWQAMKKLILNDQELKEVARQIVQGWRIRFLSLAKYYEDMEKTIAPEVRVPETRSDAEVPTPREIVNRSLRRPRDKLGRGSPTT